MEKLDKLNQAVKMFEELGMPISKQQLDAIKDAEIECLKTDVIPFIKLAIEEQTIGFRNKFELRVVFSPTDGIDVKFVDNVVQPPIPLPNSRSTRSKKEKTIRVTFPTGKVVAHPKQLDTLIAVVEYAGPMQVQTLDIVVQGDNMIRDTILPTEKVPRGLKQLSTGQYLQTASNIDMKIRQIETINNRLHLGLKVEIVDIV